MTSRSSAPKTRSEWWIIILGILDKATRAMSTSEMGAEAGVPPRTLGKYLPQLAQAKCITCRANAYRLGRTEYLIRRPRGGVVLAELKAGRAIEECTPVKPGKWSDQCAREMASADAANERDEAWIAEAHARLSASTIAAGERVG